MYVRDMRKIHDSIAHIHYSYSSEKSVKMKDEEKQNSESIAKHVDAVHCLSVFSFSFTNFLSICFCCFSLEFFSLFFRFCFFFFHFSPVCHSIKQQKLHYSLLLIPIQCVCFVLFCPVSTRRAQRLPYYFPFCSPFLGINVFV